MYIHTYLKTWHILSYMHTDITASAYIYINVYINTHYLVHTYIQTCVDIHTSESFDLVKQVNLCYCTVAYYIFNCAVM